MSRWLMIIALLLPIVHALHTRVSRGSSSRGIVRLNLFDGLKKMVGAVDTGEQLTMDNEKLIKKYMNNSMYENYSPEQLRIETEEFRKRIKSGSSLDSLLVEAFAVVREVSWRVLKLRHFDVQLMGGMALHEERLAEMATGEGKTLVAILPVYLNALTGQSAYVVTTNDYLARRDGETMGQVFKYLGMSVGIVQSFQKEEVRKQAYNCDVTYVPNQELGFDFLRDNLAMSKENVVQQRPYNFVVVDEADSILIDEARTPLIISRKGNSPIDKYITSAEISKNLVVGKHYEVNRKDQKIELTPTGYKYAEQILGKGLFELNDPWAFYVINAVKAKELFAKDKEYIVTNGQVQIIDSFSGRVLEGRRFTDGLQQSIESKEGIQVTSETQIVAKVTYQNLFRLFPKLAGMTGTAFTEAGEFLDVYQLKVLPIPTALPVARRDNSDAVFRTKEGKMKALLRNVLSTHEKGRPILIGTTSIEASEEMVAALKDIEINAKLLNARPENVERESDIVAQAGRQGAVTVATNMAGRGTDIILGGSAVGTAKVLAKYLMLCKVGLIEQPSAEALEYANQLPPMESKEPIEEENDVDVLSLPSITALAKSLDLWLPQQLQPNTELTLKRGVISCLDLLGVGAANSVAPTRLDVDNIVAQAADSAPLINPEIKLLRTALKLMTKEFDEVIKREREYVKKLGGLYVVGTSRHESRRIDNQLRGRSGRQGDPGGTRFFLSLEDDIFKIFGADKMAGMLESFRVADDMPIESDLVVQALDKVQIQVEDYSKATRSQIFKLDEVTSSQRKPIYSQRRAYLASSDDEMMDEFTKFCSKTMQEIHEAALVSNGKAKPVIGDAIMSDKLAAKVTQFFPNIDITVSELQQLPSMQVASYLSAKLAKAIEKKKSEIDTMSSWALAAFFRYLVVVQIDESWCKHLSRLDLLKEEMILQSFTAEKDVMETYREKANKLYNAIVDDVRRNTVYSLFIYKPKK